MVTFYGNIELFSFLFFLSFTISVPLSQPQPPAAPAPPVDVSCLFQKLVDAGIIPTVTADKDKDKAETVCRVLISFCYTWELNTGFC